VRIERNEKRVGLARALSKLGFCSRSQAIPLIRTGRVKLNDSVRRDPEAPVRVGRDRITVDGRELQSEQKIYLVMNKPRGHVTTASDEKGRDTVYSILQNSHEKLPWIAPVGRLDKASEGLLLFTNDSEWAARVAAPETHLEKKYHVQIDRISSDALLESIRQGVVVDGEDLTVRETDRLRAGEKTSWLEITLDEGKNRHIRRMLSALGVEVLRLIRVSIGPLQLGTLAKGTYRHLTSDEKRELDRAMNRKQSRTKGAKVHERREKHV
jgi:23S rRNA pseudouridine2605 synthase